MLKTTVDTMYEPTLNSPANIQCGHPTLNFTEFC